MIALLPVIAAVLALFSAAGLVVLAFAPREVRAALLPAVPAVGAMGLAVVLNLTSLVTGVKTGLVIVAVLGAVLLAWRSTRVAWWRGLASPLRWTALALVAGAIPFALVIGPARHQGLQLLSPPPNRDAYAYVSVADWLRDHPLTKHPDPAVDGPGLGYVRDSLNLGRRAGEELDLAAVGVLTRHDVADVYYTTTALYLAMLPGAVLALFALLGLDLRLGIVAGVVSSLGAVVAYQVINQNTDSLLGTAIAPVTVGLVARYLDAWSWTAWRSRWRRGSGARAPAPSAPTAVGARPPLWLAAGGAAALAGTYSEYLPVIAPGLALYAVLRRPHEIRLALGRALALLVAMAIIGPKISADVVVSLRFQNTLTAEATGTHFLGVPPLEAVNHLVGATPLRSDAGGHAGVPLACILAIGVILSLLVVPARRLFLALTISASGLIVYLSTVHYFPYGQERGIQMAAPFGIAFAVAGYGYAVKRLAASARWRTVALLVGIACCAAGAFFLYYNHRSIAAEVSDAEAHLPGFALNGDFGQARDWLAGVAGPGGRDAMVLDSTYFDQLWLTYTLRHSPQVHFPFIYPDFTELQDPLHYDDGIVRRYAVVGTGAFVDASPGVVVGGNPRFKFLDLSKGRAVVALGTNGFYEPETVPGVHQWMSDNGTLLVASVGGGHGVVLELSALPKLAPLPLVVDVGSTTAAQATLPASTTDVAVDVPEGSLVTVILHNGRPGVQISDVDSRVVSASLNGIRRQ